MWIILNISFLIFFLRPPAPSHSPHWHIWKLMNPLHTPYSTLGLSIVSCGLLHNHLPQPALVPCGCTWGMLASSMRSMASPRPAFPNSLDCICKKLLRLVARELELGERVGIRKKTGKQIWIDIHDVIQFSWAWNWGWKESKKMSLSPFRMYLVTRFFFFLLQSWKWHEH